MEKRITSIWTSFFDRELLENLIAPKPKKMNAQDHEELTKLLIQKDEELREALKLAAEQGEIDKQIRAVEEEVRLQDENVKEMQRKFKEAETLLVKHF